MELVLLGDDILLALRVLQISGSDLHSNLQRLWSILSTSKYKPFLIKFHEYEQSVFEGALSPDLQSRFDQLNIVVGKITFLIVEQSEVPESKKPDVLRNLRVTLDSLSYAQALVRPAWSEEIVSSSIQKVIGA